jgi:hypothetical protein
MSKPKVRVANDGAVNFCYYAPTGRNRAAQGDALRNDGIDGSWRLYLIRENQETITVRTLNHDEARAMGRAWCETPEGR